MSEPLKPRMVEGDPRDLTLLDVNARFMRHEQFQRLVTNIRDDGTLTSTPLVWNDAGSGRRIVLSGNHRTKAAIEAGLERIWWMEITEPLPRQRQIALQLSHNAITGEDDPATLRALYDELEDVSMRLYSGLDDKTLELLEEVSVPSLAEANLDFATVQIVFLPDEKEAAERALEAARKTASADARWLARIDQYEAVLDTLDSVKGAHNIGNVAAAFAILLAMVERHLGELSDGWYDPDALLATRKGSAPIETVLATRTMPADAAAVVQQAIDRMERDGEIETGHRWRALVLWAADYLAGATG
ncbi:ParB/Srx family N-terminal domain-containing protein [Streptomyces sp. LHD-70]|uniref:ParB/Srx family N-terminal domain-containing protein n=1 Tax=Streptomyces sp. LHD-70 TaxID=3072140 RepID=UPI00280E7196|nr:ParB/Srx family N-terminal domain-containing protein [Streptomyces sp. LHD-70]MDQ8706816.1 ParB/Srx family N-terminal domain-containing protein [Streptomyces sp. LHD-70]